MPFDIDSILSDEDYFDKDLSADAPYLDNFLHNRNWMYFGKLFKRICGIIDILQEDLSKLSRKKYSRILEKSPLDPKVNVGSLSNDTISRAQLAYFRPSQQQVYFWFSVLERCYQELELEIDPEIKRAFYLLSLGGPPEDIDWAIRLVKSIEKAQQSGIVKPEKIDKDTDVNLLSLPN